MGGKTVVAGPKDGHGGWRQAERDRMQKRTADGPNNVCGVLILLVLARRAERANGGYVWREGCDVRGWAAKPRSQGEREKGFRLAEAGQHGVFRSNRERSMYAFFFSVLFFLCFVQICYSNLDVGLLCCGVDLSFFLMADLFCSGRQSEGSLAHDSSVGCWFGCPSRVCGREGGGGEGGWLPRQLSADGPGSQTKSVRPRARRARGRWMGQGKKKNAHSLTLTGTASRPRAGRVEATGDNGQAGAGAGSSTLEAEDGGAICGAGLLAAAAAGVVLAQLIRRGRYDWQASEANEREESSALGGKKGKATCGQVMGLSQPNSATAAKAASWRLSVCLGRVFSLLWAARQLEWERANQIIIMNGPPLAAAAAVQRPRAQSHPSHVCAGAFWRGPRSLPSPRQPARRVSVVPYLCAPKSVFYA